MLLALPALVLGPSATAHDVLESTDPPDGAVLEAAPEQVVLTFTAPQAGVGAEVVVTGPDGAPWSEGPAVVAGPTVTQALAAGMPDGAYTVSWRSVAQDGHPVTGSFGFVVAGPPAPEPTAEATAQAAPEPEATEQPASAEETATPATSAEESPDAEDGAASRVAWAVAGLVAASVAAGALVLRRRAGRTVAVPGDQGDHDD